MFIQIVVEDKTRKKSVSPKACEKKKEIGCSGEKGVVVEGEKVWQNYGQDKKVKEKEEKRRF